MWVSSDGAGIGETDSESDTFWVVFSLLNVLIMFPVPLVMSLVFRLKRQSYDENNPDLHVILGVATWTGLGMFITFVWLIVSLILCYIMSMNMSETENETWLLIWALTLLFEVVFGQLIKVLFKACLMKAFKAPTGCMGKLIYDL
jgi:hypothetical protein